MFYLKIHLLPVLLSAVCILIFCGIFSGCYTFKQGAVMLGYLNQAVPLEQLSLKNTKSEEFVRLVTDIRRFAVEELGLATSKNYTTYVELDRDYLAAVVSASENDFFKHYEWYFPVVGSMPYKGFFDIEDAKKERIKLEKKNLDVWIRRVDAFSTLGWFKDPLYSYMQDYSPGRLADLIIHELVHATVFIKGQVQFNEELAEFIGSKGAVLYVKSRYGTDSAEYRELLTSNSEYENFFTFIQELITELEVLYSNDIGKEEKLIKKGMIINAAQKRFETEYEKNFSSDNYRGFSELPINNAYLELHRLYHAEDNFYDDLFNRYGQNLPAFISAAKTISKKGNPRAQLEKALLPSYILNGE
jgi:predicted aminopeptidase